MPTERHAHRREHAPRRPLRELEEMKRRLEDDIARPFLRSIWDRIPEEVKRWAPSIDIWEKDDDFVVKVELPGMKYEDIDVSVLEDTLIIKGEKKLERGIKDEDYHRSEIAYGSFYRSILVPSTIDTNDIEAVYEDGVLRVTLKRASGAKPQKIEVKVKQEEA